MSRGATVGYTQEGKIFLAINTMINDKPYQTIMEMPPHEAMNLAKMLIDTAEKYGVKEGNNVGDGTNLN
jgi:hypothetical protein